MFAATKMKYFSDGKKDTDSDIFKSAAKDSKSSCSKPLIQSPPLNNKSSSAFSNDSQTDDLLSLASKAKPASTTKKDKIDIFRKSLFGGKSLVKKDDNAQ